MNDDPTTYNRSNDIDDRPGSDFGPIADGCDPWTCEARAGGEHSTSCIPVDAYLALVDAIVNGRPDYGLPLSRI